MLKKPDNWEKALIQAAFGQKNNKEALYHTNIQWWISFYRSLAVVCCFLEPLLKFQGLRKPLLPLVQLLSSDTSRHCLLIIMRGIGHH